MNTRPLKFLFALLIFHLPFSSQAAPLEGLQQVSSYKLTVLGYLKILSASLHSNVEANSLKFPSESDLALNFEYHRNISRAELIKRGNDALRTQFDDSVIDRHSMALEQINASYEDVSKGDSYTIRFTPTEGLTLYLNEQFVINVPDDDFARFYLSIWLGESTPNQTLRKSLIPSLK